jgi:GMP synthase-like glutamine amidotransferase
MKPVAIIRHSASEGPAYFATYLERRSIPWQLVALDAGEPVPRDVAGFSGLALMGGPMSANDPLPWVAPVLELIRDAVRKDIPAIGHCLGGQLMSKAFGGTVRASAVREIGWGEVRVADNAVARDWLGELPAFESFHWHGETFSIPPGGTRVLENAYCENQAYALGRHFGMQCHVEMTEELVRTWLRSGGDELRNSENSPAVQRPEQIEADLQKKLEQLHAVADRIYDRWTQGLSRGS